MIEWDHSGCSVYASLASQSTKKRSDNTPSTPPLHVSPRNVRESDLKDPKDLVTVPVLNILRTEL